MTDLEIKELKRENKRLKRKLVLLKKKCNKLVVAAYNTSESNINKLSLLKKENQKLKNAIEVIIKYEVKPSALINMLTHLKTLYGLKIPFEYVKTYLDFNGTEKELELLKEVLDA